MSVRGFFCGLFLLVVWLIALLTGGCTLFFLFQMLSDAITGNPYVGVSDIALVLMVGGIPFLVGVGIIKIGSFIRGNSEEYFYCVG